MPAQIFGAQAAVSFLNRAFANTSPSNAVYTNQVANATASLPAGTDATAAGNYTAFAKTFGAAYAGQTAAHLSTLLMTNLGLLPNAALETALADYITAAGTANVGVVALQLAGLLSAKEGDATYGAAATAWNTEVTNSFSYSSNAASTGSFSGEHTTSTGTTSTFTLTTGQDYADATSSIKNGGLLPSTFVFTTGNETVTAGAATLTNNDALVDSSTADADVLNATLNSGAAANPTAIQNIETINLTATVANSGLDFTNITGTKAVTLAGAVNAQLTNLGTTAPTIELKDYTKVATVSTATLAGTADALTVKVSGATATATVIPGVTLDSAVAGTLETLNLESAGTTKNTIALTANANAQALTKTVVTGAADLDLRVASGLVNGQTLDAAGHAGALNLIVDRNGVTTAVTNLTNATGVDTYTFRDSTAGGDAVVASGLASGSTAVITYGTTGASSLSVKNAVSGTADVLTVTVDHATDATDVAVATSLTISDVETVNIKSEGGTTTGSSIAGLTMTAASKVNLDGATKMDLQLAATSTVASVTVTGAGAHKVDFAGAVTYTEAKTLTIDGSAATGKLTLDGSDFTGTGGGVAETLTIKGGTTDDTITGTADANAKNVIDAGAGVDTVTVTTANASNVTLGAGADKVTINTVAGTAVVTFTDFALGTGGDVLSVNSAGAMTLGANGTASANNQLVIQTAAVADNTAAAALVSGTATAEAAVIVINNATGVAELWYDADGTAGGEVKLASFENITTVGVLTNATTGFVAANFGTWA